MKAVSVLVATISTLCFMAAVTEAQTRGKIDREERPRPPPTDLRSPEDLDKFDFEVDGDVGSLKEAMATGEISIEVIEKDDEDEDDEGEDMNRETTLGDIKSIQDNANVLKREFEITPTRPPIFDGRCKKIPGFGFANNPVLTIFGKFSLRPFNVRLSCREKCCTRTWSCDYRSCKLRCHKYTIRIYSNPRFYCCRVEGTVVNPFPSGECSDDVLCMA